MALEDVNSASAKGTCMAERRPIPVRLDEDLIVRLDEVARRIGSNRAAVIRFCVQTFVEHVAAQVRAPLAPDWYEIIRRIESREPLSRGAPARPLAAPTGRGAADTALTRTQVYADALIESTLGAVEGNRHKAKRSGARQGRTRASKARLR